jgi:hypothetical protein
MIDIINAFWGITPEVTFSDEFTGYEDFYDQLDKHTIESYKKDPAGTIEEVFNIYRSRNLVPIVYFTEVGLSKAIKQFQRAKYQPVINGRIGVGNNKGATINRFLFTNMQTAEPKGEGSNSLKDRFYDDNKLKRAIRICFEFRDGNNLVRPRLIRTALELVTGNNITNFKAQNARSIVEHLCPVMWGRVYDYSMGYGGRLLGTSASNMNYTYIGTDPNTETYDRLQYLNTFLNSDNELICDVSENYQPEDIDCAFSSPPYFNLEKYSDEPTQCMVQFNSIDDWFEGYAVSTMKNIYKGLNKDGIFATNIADYKVGKAEYNVVEKWKDLAQKVGFKYEKTLKMMLNTRPGVGNGKQEKREKWEGVYVFRK